MSVIVRGAHDKVCKNCGQGTQMYYVALKNDKYSHMFDCVTPA